MNKNTERQFWIEFLKIYKSLPVLWQVKSAEYCNRVLKSEAYDIMVQKLKEIDPNADRESVVRKINNFRSSYRRDLKKRKKSEKSGAGAEDVFQSSLWYFDVLSFLEDQEDTLEGISTTDENEKDNENSEGIPQSASRPGTSKRKRSQKEEDTSLKMPCEHLKESSNDATTLAKGWAAQYSELSNNQKVFARKLFSDVLFAGCLGKLNERVVHGVHRLLESSSKSSPS